jgi:ribonuclease Z
MRFSLTILGSSSAVPTAARNTTAHVLNVHERFYLLDCGEGTQIQIRRNRIRFGRLHTIFISHLHSDHILGLFGLLSTMSLLGRKVPLDLYCPPGLEQIIDSHFRLMPDQLQYPLVYHEHPAEGKCLIHSDKAVNVYSFPVRHRSPAWGFLFEEKINGGGSSQYLPRTFAFCTDTLFHPPLAGFFPEVDLLYHEATYSSVHESRAKSTAHSTAMQAGQMALLSGAKQLLIGHYSARYKEIDQLVAEARSVFPNTLGATDGMSVDIERRLNEK